MANNLSCKRKGFINKNWEISHQFLLGLHFKKLFLHLAKSKEINLISPYPTHTLHSHIPYEPFLKINQYLVTCNILIMNIFYEKCDQLVTLLSLVLNESFSCSFPKKLHEPPLHHKPGHSEKQSPYPSLNIKLLM